MSRSRASERGAALLLALILLVLTTTSGLLLAVALSIDLREQKEDSRRARLTALVDSATAEALAALADDPDAAGFAPRPFGGGEIESDIRDLPDGSREILATARLAGATRRARAQVVLGPHGPRIVAWRPGTRSG